MFELKDKVTFGVVKVYAVRSDGKRTEFLIYEDTYGFVWNDSSYFEPLDD